MVVEAVRKWGRVDILVNNAGILRDRSFAKMTPEDWRAVIDVHLNGSANCTLAVWNQMREQNYGRVLMTSSTSGIYGNFGQANYGAAKMGIVGLMNTLAIEGAKYGIRVNTLVPTAATRMTEDILNAEMLDMLKPEYVTPAAVFLVSEDAPNRTVMFAGAGHFSTMEIRESKGVHLPPGRRDADCVAEQFAAISSMADADIYTEGRSHAVMILAAEAEQRRQAGG